MKELIRKDGWGLWAVHDIKVRYINKDWVQISIEHKVTNGDTEHINVYYTPFDRLFGVDFDEKVRNKLVEFKEKYEKRNEEIIRLRKKENLFNSH